MVAEADIKWGKYKDHQGPVYWGRNRYELRPDATEDERVLYVAIAPEAGMYDAYNGYDSCLCSAGLLQWCESNAIFGVTKLLNALRPQDLAPLDIVLKKYGFRFDFAPDKKTREFQALHSDGQVDAVRSKEMQKALFFGMFGDVNESRASWSVQTWSKAIAAGIIAVLENPATFEAHAAFAIQELPKYMLPAGRTFLEVVQHFTPQYLAPAKAVYLSYAINNPTLAAELAKKAVAHGSPEPLRRLLQEGSTFTKSKIFEERTPKVVEALVVAFPALQGIQGAVRKHYAPVMTKKPKFDTVELQKALMVLGYDLGPKGADGIPGAKTRTAVKELQAHASLAPTGDIDDATMQELTQRLHAYGVAELKMKT